VQEELQIAFRNFESSPWIEQRVRDEVALLERYYPRIIGLRVVLELAHRHHLSGNRYRVRIEIELPGEDIVVNHEPDLYASLKDIDVERLTREAEVEPERKHLVVAIDDAFETARRRLQDFARRQRGDVKTHQPRPTGKVVRLDVDGEFGFIEALDGHEVYFHRNSVLGDEYDRLEVGNEVMFSEEAGDKGPQASTVRRIRKHHYAPA
jgi:cold shock CspA family protein/ribosome-associated translation inhibitor RaiA